MADRKKKKRQKPIIDLCITCIYDPKECDAKTETYSKKGPHFGKVIKCNTYKKGGEVREDKKVPEPELNILDDEPEAEVFGACSVCEHPLERTAFNNRMDAIRCLNKSCRMYRAIIKQIEFKSKIKRKVENEEGEEEIR